MVVGTCLLWDDGLLEEDEMKIHQDLVFVTVLFWELMLKNQLPHVEHNKNVESVKTQQSEFKFILKIKKLQSETTFYN